MLYLYIQVALVVLLFVLVALAGSTRRVGWRWTLFFSILFTPIGGYLIACLSKPRRRERQPKPKVRFWHRKAPEAAVG